MREVSAEARERLLKGIRKEVEMVRVKGVMQEERGKGKGVGEGKEREKVDTSAVSKGEGVIVEGLGGGWLGLVVGE